MRASVTTRVEVGRDSLYEVDDVGNGGTLFPFGDFAIKYPCDEHRRHYSRADAVAVAEMVNVSSWITRAGR